MYSAGLLPLVPWWTPVIKRPGSECLLAHLPTMSNVDLVGNAASELHKILSVVFVT